MKLIKSITSILVALFLLIGVVGVDVFSHSCKLKGTSVSYVFAPDNHCGRHLNKKEKANCCLPSHDQEENSNNCCDNQYTHFQLEVDFTYNLSQLHFQVPTNVYSFRFETELPTLAELTVSPSQHSPPPKSASERCILLQTFLI